MDHASISSARLLRRSEVNSSSGQKDEETLISPCLSQTDNTCLA